MRRITTFLLAGAMCVFALPAPHTNPAKGPLKVLASNPRFFTDGSGKAVYLAGSHNWVNFKDYGESDSLNRFDYKAYLDFLQAHNHNFFRLWTWELPRSTLGRNAETWVRSPFPWKRSGPGVATDGKPKFDLSRLDDAYFDRLRDRVKIARDRGFYVAVTLFDGYGPINNRSAEDGFPFDTGNNVNNLACGGLETQTLAIAGVTTVQENYVRKVVEKLNDLDNVLYEIANEAGPASTEWQYHMIKFIKECEAKKPKKHPVGMSYQLGGKNEALFKSPADWIAPGKDDGYQSEPPASEGTKVIINDTDHSYYWVQLKEAGLPAQQAWVWKSFTRGLNVAFMDPYLINWPGRNAPQGLSPDTYWETIRVNMGYARRFAGRVNLAAMKPIDSLSSTRYCLASPTDKCAEFLVYAPQGGSVDLKLNAVKGKLYPEWFNPSVGSTETGEPVDGGAERSLKTPFIGDAVLYLTQKAPVVKKEPKKKAKK